ncbi:MAG: hypothetical protein ACI91B_003140 [Planctomycetota bacterium]|jgi:hypothetical protein
MVALGIPPIIDRQLVSSSARQLVNSATMSSLFRNVLVLLVAALLAIPTVCDEGGENNGGGGVWILPCCANIGGVNIQPGSAARATMLLSNTASDMSMRTECQMGASTATFVDDLSGVPVSLSVSGRIVTVSSALLQALEASSKKTATIIVTDAQQCGYVMRVLIQPDGSVKITVH